MNKQEYIAPRAELIVVDAQLMDHTSGYAVDGDYQGEVVENDDSSLDWGMND